MDIQPEKAAKLEGQESALSADKPKRAFLIGVALNLGRATRAVKNSFQVIGTTAKKVGSATAHKQSATDVDQTETVSAAPLKEVVPETKKEKTEEPIKVADEVQTTDSDKKQSRRTKTD